MRRRTLPLAALLLWSLVTGVSAETVVQRENVSYEYARVLRVTPVYQTLTATSVETRCDDESRLSKIVGSVRNVLKRDQSTGSTSCRPVPVERQFKRPIAYDVDYTYRGAKYRSRLSDDPGHLLRIRVSVMPVP
ncbi:hypothetical protein [Cognatilysobacter terrigena]|uniref:hypothetical protein n=1 Tax=Cognatilysobacter terrigena TaxID=2488749 RepID=UPI001FECF6B9|nr:hypothetical protein [Lysobacter terrigena]